MNELTKNLRTHICYIKEWDETIELQITKEQYQIIREDIENLKANDFYKFTDIDTWKTLFDWQKKDILRFKEKNLNWNSNYKVICDYWNKHDLINWWYSCDCYQKYWFFAIDFKIYMRDKYWIMYMQDTTEGHKREFYKHLKSNWKI